MNKKVLLILLLLLIAGLVSTPFLVKLPGKTRLWGEIQNFGHTPLSGALALLVLWILHLRKGNKSANPIVPYFISFGIAISLGGSIEIAQFYLPGEPDWMDFARDVLGAGAFLAFFASFDRNLLSQHGKNQARVLKIPLFISGILISVSLIPALLWAGAYVHRNSGFPVICDFDSRWENKFIGTQGASLKAVHPPEGWKKDHDNLVGQLDFQSKGYRGFYIEEPGRDWSSYKNLRMEIYSASDSSLDLLIRVEDFTGNTDDKDRFNKVVMIKPGLNEISVPVDDIKHGPISHNLDLANIRDLYILAIKPRTSMTLYIDNIRLES